MNPKVSEGILKCISEAPFGDFYYYGLLRVMSSLSLSLKFSAKIIKTFHPSLPPRETKVERERERERGKRNADIIFQLRIIRIIRIILFAERKGTR